MRTRWRGLLSCAEGSAGSPAPSSTNVTYDNSERERQREELRERRERWTGRGRRDGRRRDGEYGAEKNQTFSNIISEISCVRISNMIYDAATANRSALSR